MVLARCGLSVALIFFVSSASALFIDTNLFYLSDSLVTSTATNTSTKTFYDFTIGFSVDKKGNFQVGWNYAAYSTADSVASATTTYSSAQMGPKFIYFFDKDRNWRSSFAYNISTSATYTASSIEDKWKGTGMAMDFGYQFRGPDGFSLGIRLNYSTTTFNESLIGTTYTTVSNVRTFIYPSVSVAFDL